MALPTNKQGSNAAVRVIRNVIQQEVAMPALVGGVEPSEASKGDPADITDAGQNPPFFEIGRHSFNDWPGGVPLWVLG